MDSLRQEAASDIAVHGGEVFEGLEDHLSKRNRETAVSVFYRLETLATVGTSAADCKGGRVRIVGEHSACLLDPP